MKYQAIAGKGYWRNEASGTFTRENTIWWVKSPIVDTDCIAGLSRLPRGNDMYFWKFVLLRGNLAGSVRVIKDFKQVLGDCEETLYPPFILMTA